ncbi:MULTISPECIES: YihY/virulence factor BrkB family protein [unclassified Microbacterium]|uniref:YihY/virulence factor BrkB family protein n=1 Tax=unclassified Microbacterium TaxID=2609290 RepID=UPI002468CD27|nr:MULTISPECIES: YihY/virulence factor BrkB family protein [unclassified Microbacterium]MDH5133456.1 YihY/virulence factor BrkB family protein [Microbacterium sp. RD10]MDH5137212.1 YihY/virulence factor BrkB family protein [Microbacterium sp. RD11]MDH5144557.1 YihY/virulence factor BrkB family protein [Microbacterium sp. RD12]MDH5155271.1 YihY/virulence factor BrkB family protein [Microbacterium sp. RD06]MDH5165320.1 YihY/virulence factor BrkB family protein [Microbacterium sp. RD02]
MSEPGSATDGRLDAAVERATALTRRTLGLFPVRVWRHFLQHNGFLLAAGVSYQALFAIFAAVYLAFAITGLWLGGSEEAVNGLIDIINNYIPNLILDEGGVFTPAQVQEIASNTTGFLGITGLIALGTVIWTAIGWVTFSRRAVRDIFGLEPDRRSYLLLKARDLLAALIFGVSLILGSALSSASAAVLSWVLSLLGWDAGSDGLNLGIRIGTVLVSFVLLTGALAAMVRFLTGTSLHWSTIWPGALLGGAAMTVLQFGVGFLLSYTPSNPLLATFAIFVGLLLWFRVNGVVMLVAASWIAVAAQDRDLPLLLPTEAERRVAEHATLLAAARIRLRDARTAQDEAPWYRSWAAGHAVREAEDEVARLEASAPPPAPPTSPLAQRLLSELDHRQNRDVGGAR